jgi:hypothetical protein
MTDEDEWRGQDGLLLEFHHHGVALEIPHFVRDGVYLKGFQPANRDFSPTAVWAFVNLKNRKSFFGVPEQSIYALFDD